MIHDAPKNKLFSTNLWHLRLRFDFEKCLFAGLSFWKQLVVVKTDSIHVEPQKKKELSHLVANSNGYCFTFHTSFTIVIYLWLYVFLAHYDTLGWKRAGLLSLG